MKVRIKSLLVAGCLSLIGMVQLMAQDVQSGIKALESEQYTKAQGIFQGLVTAAPTAENYFYLGYYYLRLDKAAEAKAAFEKGLAADPKYLLNNVGLGGVALLSKDRAGAKAQIDQALAASKNKDENVLWRAAEMYTLFEEANDPAEAIRLIDAISLLKKKSNNPEFSMVKGDALLIKNEGGPAATEYERVIQANPVAYLKAKAATRLGVIFKRGKNYGTEGAQKWFNQAINDDPDFSPVYREYGELWLLARQYKNAAKNYKDYRSKAEVTPESDLRYAKFAFLSKDYESSLLVLNQLKGKINDPDIPRMYGYSYFETEKYDLSIENLEQLLKTIPQEKQLTSDYGYLGKGYAKLKKDEEAMKYLMMAAPVDTNENYYLDIFNIQFTNQKKYKEAAETYKKVITWKTAKKERVGTNEYMALGRAYYFASAVTAKAAKDTLAMVALAQKADSSFALIAAVNAAYSAQHLWRARANLLVDVDKTGGQAIPHYEKFVEMNWTDAANKEKNKRDLLEATKYLAYWYATKADAAKLQDYANKALELAPDDAAVKELLNPSTPPATPTTPPKQGGATTPPKQ
ncbi:MAG: hypothetical protein U0Y10_01010 [Spirosomataceae bacterium]